MTNSAPCEILLRTSWSVLLLEDGHWRLKPGRRQKKKLRITGASYGVFPNCQRLSSCLFPGMSGPAGFLGLS